MIQIAELINHFVNGIVKKINMKKVILIGIVVLFAACGTGVKPEEIKTDSVKADSTQVVDSLIVKK